MESPVPRRAGGWPTAADSGGTDSDSDQYRLTREEKAKFGYPSPASYNVKYDLVRRSSPKFSIRGRYPEKIECTTCDCDWYLPKRDEPPTITLKSRQAT